MQHRKKSIFIYIIVVILAILVPSAPFIFAALNRNDTKVQIQTSEDFYFESSFINANNNRIVAGDLSHTIEIDIKNYTDDLKINNSNIYYSFSITATNDYTNFTSTINNSLTPSGYLLAGNNKSENTLELVCQNGYVDGTQLTINIISSAPYVKTLTLTITLSTQKVNSYWIVDEISTIELCIIIVEQIPANVLQIEWDNTKLVIYNNDEDVISATKLPNANDYNKIKLEALEANASVKIKFFKNFITENYSLEETPISDNKIEI